TRVAFSLAPGKLSDIVESPLGFHLLRVEEKKPAEDRSFEAVKTQIALQTYKREKAQTEARSRAQAALASAKGGKKLSDRFSTAAASMAFTTESKPELIDTGSFSLEESAVPKLGAAPAVQEAVRQKGEPGLLPQLLPAGDGLALVEVTERKQPDETEYAKQR